ncbi:L-iditol 2-dehydrogenase [Usnea florida]
MAEKSENQNLSCFLYGPKEAKYEDRPIPEINDPHDVIIRINYIGVCGSDVHWYLNASIGAAAIRPGSPLVLGHEASGTVHATGPAVHTLRPGDRVALEPGFPCRRCPRCKEGRYNLCPNMTFAASPPANHGTLCKFFKLPEDYCWKLPDHVSLAEGVLVEPAAVAVHMARLVDVRPGQSVVVFGSGTVGLLCGAVARAFGAAKIVMVDLLDAKLQVAKRFVEGCGTFTPNASLSPEQNAANIISQFHLDPGADVVLEASGAEPAVQTGIHVLRLGGSYVQGGLGRNIISFPIVTLSEKELTVKGCFRYSTGDFELALGFIAEGRLRVKELVTKEVSFGEAVEAWETTWRGEGIKTLIRGVRD